MFFQFKRTGYRPCGGKQEPQKSFGRKVPNRVSTFPLR
jgi:hypothetical protein